MPIYSKLFQDRANLWLPVEEVESAALDQIRNVTNLPVLAGPVAIMPDCHYGAGATVGSVIPFKGALAPSTVGVDIACGMGIVKTNLKSHQILPFKAAIREEIEQRIPVGFAKHSTNAWATVGEKIYTEAYNLLQEFPSLADEVTETDHQMNTASLQLGTLGGGNHFIEVCQDENKNVCFMLHSGSRNTGLKIATAHIKKARALDHNKCLPDLAYFVDGTKEFDDYWHDLQWAQRYAILNRRVIAELVKQVFIDLFPGEVYFGGEIWCHHNYVSMEIHDGQEIYVTRKGAISAARKELGIIPGSMGTRSYITVGLGNKDSYCSASHGAGRAMSRSAAKKKFNMTDVEEQLKGIECRQDKGIIDELPGAYKDIDVVMEHERDLVKPIHVLNQLICVKG